MTLTEREVEVLRLLKEGKTQAQIAKTLKITQPAVSAFKRNAEYKIRDASELIKRAKELGLLLIAFAFFFSWTPDAFAVTPNPGHAAYTVGPGMNGSFYNGNYTFPNNLNVTQNLTVVGTTNLTGTTYLGRAYINGSIGPGVNGALNVVGSVFVETSGGYNGISIGAPWYQGIWRSASSGATIISGPSGPGVKLIYNNDENSVLANFNTSMMSIENLDINF